MTVKELIKKLLDTPQDAVVLTDRGRIYDVGRDEITDVGFWISLTNGVQSVVMLSRKVYD